MKIQSLAGLCLLSISLTACQAEPTTEYYLTPIVTGQVLDKDTSEPLDGVTIIYTSREFVETNKDGFFRLPAIKYDVSSSPDYWELNQISESSMAVHRENYRRKSYWNFVFPRLKVSRSFEVPGYVHIGKIYLERLPSGVSTNDVEDDFIEDMTFCQPNESQKDVNCIPVPEGKTYEQVSPNQPIQ
ncbi:hypothetical protein [uncultured Psychrobacter sp.]|uniref:hypothetical protein n=1 Tax=uncultured Psychrobacter sp. TaxID=259303 RepID=UPI0034575E0B